MMKFIILVQLALYLQVVLSAVVPIFDIEKDWIGFVGTISEKDVRVYLKPDLQMKNANEINGICSYHVFKPFGEDFPFNIDIQNQTTGKAVIELLKASKNVEKTDFLDCKKKKEYRFLIQAFDCTELIAEGTKRVPVLIQVLDLKFEEESYNRTLVESESIYEKLMTIRARDQDCSGGFACSYKIIDQPMSYAFRIDQLTGEISSTRALKSGESFDFKVRAFDCVTNQSYVETDVSINVVEMCVPQWTNYSVEIISKMGAINVFDRINSSSNEQHWLFSNENRRCEDFEIESVDSIVTLNLDSKLQKANCRQICENTTIRCGLYLFLRFRSNQSISKNDTKETVKKPQQTCKNICNEAIELRQLNGSKNWSAKMNEIRIKTKSLNEMKELLRKVAYVNKQPNPKSGNRSINLSTTLKCWNGRPHKMRDVEIPIRVKRPKESSFNIIQGEMSLFAIDNKNSEIFIQFMRFYYKL